MWYLAAAKRLTRLKTRCEVDHFVVPGDSKEFDQTDNKMRGGPQDVRWTILWYLAVAKHLTKLKAKCEVDRFVVPGGSKAFDQFKTIYEVDRLVVLGGSKASDQIENKM